MTDNARLIDTLNAALSEEWIAYYQQWVYAQMIRGPRHAEIRASLINRTHDELRHAQILAERIIELGGVPALTPCEWLQRARCVYDAPTSYDSPQLLRSLVIGASCLAQRYEELSENTRGSDPVTSRLADAMFADHSDHERRLQSVLDGILAAAR